MLVYYGSVTVAVMSSTERRVRAWRRGVRAESVAAFWLRWHGYRIIARRFRCGLGEIDIIAERGGVLAIIEVKAYRPRYGEPPISRRQRIRLVGAARAAMGRWPRLANLQPRFDLFVWCGLSWPRHYRGVFDAVDL